MKCIACGHDNNLKDRTANNGCCSQCSHRFVFEPTTMTAPVKFTDALFAKAIADLSAENTLYFTPRQLYYFLNRRLKRKVNTTTTIGCLVGFIILLILSTLFFGGAVAESSGSLAPFFIPSVLLTVFAFVFNIAAFRQRSANVRSRRSLATALQIIGVINLILGVGFNLIYLSPMLGFQASITWLIASVLLGMGAILLGYFQKSRLVDTSETPLFDVTRVNDWLARWSHVNGAPPTLLPSPKESQAPAPVNPEISAYSFDRVIVTSSTAIAHMLIANNLHLEHNCAILSVTGYPQSIFSTVMDMLRRNPNLTVYALHDATPRGMSLMYTLRTDAHWFRGQEVQLVDLGLSPRQIFAQGAFSVYNSTQSAGEFKRLPVGARQALLDEEAKWLEKGNYIELEAFGPQKLLQVIRAGIGAQTSSDADSMLWNDTDSGALAMTSFG